MFKYNSFPISSNNKPVHTTAVVCQTDKKYCVVNERGCLRFIWIVRIFIYLDSLSKIWTYWIVIIEKKKTKPNQIKKKNHPPKYLTSFVWSNFKNFLHWTMVWNGQDLQGEVICHYNSCYSGEKRTSSWTRKRTACLPGRLPVRNSSYFLLDELILSLSQTLLTNSLNPSQLEQCYDKSKDCYKRKHPKPYERLKHWLNSVRNLCYQILSTCLNGSTFAIYIPSAKHLLVEVNWLFNLLSDFISWPVSTCHLLQH